MSEFIPALKLLQKKESNLEFSPKKNPSKEALQRIKWVCTFCPQKNICSGKLPKIEQGRSKDLEFAWSNVDTKLFLALLRENENNISSIICNLRGWLYHKALQNEYTPHLKKSIIELLDVNQGNLIF